MKITKVSVKIIPDRPRLKGTASIVFDDCFKVRDILILPKNADQMYASLPSRKMKDGTYISLAHPITAEFRQTIESAIFAEYERLMRAGLDRTEMDSAPVADEDDDDE